MIRINGIQTYPTTGQLDLTTVLVTSASAPTQPAGGTGRVLVAASRRAAAGLGLLTGHDRGPGHTARPGACRARRTMRSWPRCARPTSRSTEMPMITAVTVGAPAQGKLATRRPDRVGRRSIKIKQVDDVGTAIRRYEVGEQVPFVVLRHGRRTAGRGEHGLIVRPGRRPGGRDHGGHRVLLRAEHLLRSRRGARVDRAPGWSSRWRSTTRSPPARCWTAAMWPAPARSPGRRPLARSAGFSRRSPEPSRPEPPSSSSRPPTARRRGARTHVSLVKVDSLDDGRRELNEVDAGVRMPRLRPVLPQVTDQVTPGPGDARPGDPRPVRRAGRGADRDRASRRQCGLGPAGPTVRPGRHRAG